MKSGASRKAARRAALGGLALAALALLGADRASAYVRIVIDGRILAWSTPTIAWNLHPAGSADIADGSHEVAIQKAFDAWDGVGGSRLAFARGPDLAHSPGASSHVVMFDESGETGYFPPLSGIVALTPISYDTGSGRILDADLIFNGRDYSWSTDGSDGTFDVQDVLTHEIGHFIGLDHSPHLSGSMWPYVSEGQWLHRSLTLDDRSGAIAVAEQPDQTRLSGFVRRAGNPVPGAAVCAIRAEDGRLAATALTAADGSWVLKGVPVGDYHVYACPLEGGMDEGNLTGNGAVGLNFAPAFYGGFGTPDVFSLAGGGNVVCGNLAVPANTPLLESNYAPIVLRRGQSQWVTVNGSGFTAGAMDFLVKSPHFAVAGTSSGATFVRALVTVAPDATYGQYDVYVRDPLGNLEIATGLLDVVAPPPELLLLSAPTADAGGGTEIALTGAGFQEGAYVLFGGVEALEVEFVSATELRAITPAAVPGPAAVAVHNPDGQQSVLDGAFQFTAIPVFREVFPEAGQASGGTTVLVHGGSFAPDLQILLDGAPLPVTWLSARVARVTMPAHDAGAADLVLRNPGQPETVAPAAFRFVDTPDPRITDFTPDRGPRAGGTRVRLQGSNLGGVVEVRFGVDSVTALGGVRAAGVDVLSAGRVDAVTAQQPQAGVYGLVAITGTGQGAFVDGFTFEGDGNPGGAGVSLSAGGCAGSLGGRAADPRAPAADALLLGLFAGAFLLLRRRGLR